MAHKDIKQAEENFKSGVQEPGAARRWRDNAESNANDYNDSFGPILSDQNNCADELPENAGGYERLVDYADCMQGSE